MIKVGLTGGIGSGKTTVAHIFEVLGIPVYYADIEAKKLMNENAAIKQQIIYHFGEKSYVDGLLNKRYISSIIFNDPEKLAIINGITHPITIANAELWMKQQKSVYAIKEAALIFEAGAEKNLDIVIGVRSPVGLRIKRVMERENITEQEVMEKMEKQMNEDEKMSRCNYIIENDEVQMLIPQVLEIHKKICANC